MVGKLDDLEAQLAVAGTRQLHRRSQLGEQPRPAPLLQPLHHRLQDDEAHSREPFQLLVAMDPPLEIHLPQALETDPIGDVDQVADLDGVTREEGDRLEHAPAPGILAREWLDEPRKLRVEQVDERPSDQLRDPAAAALLQDSAFHDRPAVVALDVLDPLLGDERADRSVDHPRVPVADVRVRPDHDVAGRLVEALPERLALAAVAAVARQHLAVDRYPGSLGGGDLPRAVLGVGVHDQELID